MKQMVIIEIPNLEEKNRSKALKILVGVKGVESVTLQGEDKDQIEVIGDGVDSVHLVKLLRRKLKPVELLSVTPLNEDSIDTFDDAPQVYYPTYHRHPSNQAVVPYVPRSNYVDNGGYGPNYHAYHSYKSNYYDYPGYRSNPDGCTIL